MKLATKVRTRYQIAGGVWEGYDYEVGKIGHIPDRDTDVVKEIHVYHGKYKSVDVVFEEYGILTLIQDIRYIYYENAEYREILRKKEELRKAKGSKGE